MRTEISKALVKARERCLWKEDAYWLAEPIDFSRPVSARNEAAALSWLLVLQPVLCRGGPADVAELQALCAGYCDRVGAGAAPEDEGEAGADGGSAASTSGRSFGPDSAEAALQRWCTERGVSGCAYPALFGGGAPHTAPAPGDGTPAAAAAAGQGPLRGLRADAAVAPGDVVLSVPEALLLSYDTAKQSDLGKVLVALPLGLDDETIALIWSCVERREPEAAAAPFWAALPGRFATLLSAPEEAVAALAGTPLHAEAVAARRHLRAAFDAAAPAFTSLLAAYPSYFRPEWFDWEAWLWAAELWYSYGIEVQFSDGTLRTCLAPLLGLMNHHPLPHVVSFSRVDPDTQCIGVRAFRPCAPGRQLFLSYGPLPNAKLLLFYGFALEGNPFDEVPLVLQLPPNCTTYCGDLLSAVDVDPAAQRLRPGGALSPALLAAARVLGPPLHELAPLKKMSPAELKAVLMAPPAPPPPAEGGSEGAGGGAGRDGKKRAWDAAACKFLEKTIGAMLGPAVECAARLREGGKSGGGGGDAEAATDGSATHGSDAGADAARRGELAHFMRVYAEGVVRTLEDSLAAVRRLQAA